MPGEIAEPIPMRTDVGTCESCEKELAQWLVQVDNELFFVCEGCKP